MQYSSWKGCFSNRTPLQVMVISETDKAIAAHIVEFIPDGAARSAAGKSILALTSTYRNAVGEVQSRILPVFSEGTVTITSRNDIQWVLTEYGAAGSVLEKHTGESQSPDRPCPY